MKRRTFLKGVLATVAAAIAARIAPAQEKRVALHSDDFTIDDGDFLGWDDGLTMVIGHRDDTNEIIGDWKVDWLDFQELSEKYGPGHCVDSKGRRIQ